MFTSLAAVTALSLLLLFFSILAVYLKVQEKSWVKFWLMVGVYLLMCFPVCYTVYRELTAPSLGSSDSLAIAFFFTWGLTAIMFIVSVVFHYNTQNNDDYSLF